MGDDAFDNLERETIEKERMRDAAGDTTSGDVPRDPGASAPPPSDPHDADSGDRAPNAPRDPFYRLTEGGNAARFVDMFAGKLRYVEEWGWVPYDGKRWCRGGGGETAAERAARAVVQVLYEEAGEAVSEASELAAQHADLIAEANLDGRKNENKEKREAARRTAEFQEYEGAASAAAHMRQWATASDTAKAMVAMLKIARSDPRISARPEQFDRNVFLLNLKNGTLDLSQGSCGRKYDHRPEDMITKLADVEYDPEAKCPQWDAFLSKMIPDSALRAWWARYLGYCLTGDVSEQCWAFAVGEGSNGKNVIAEVFLKMLGDYAGIATRDLFILKTNESHPTGIADLAGKRFVVASEIDPSKCWDEATLKSLTGDGRIKGRFVHKDGFDFDMEAKIMVTANGRLKVRDTSDGFYRRVNLVPFTVQVTGDQVDKKLKDKLLEERAGILAWAVRGCKEWHAGGLKPPKAITDLVAYYRGEQDAVGQWLSERCACVCKSIRPDIGSDNDEALATCDTCKAAVVSKKEWESMPGNAVELEERRRLHETGVDLYADYDGWCRSRGETPWTWSSLRSELIKRGRVYKHTKHGTALSGIRLRHVEPIPTKKTGRMSSW